MDGLFLGPEMPLPKAKQSIWVQVPGTPPPARVTHATGCRQFTAMVAAAGLDPRTLIDDPWAYVAFVGSRRHALENHPDLMRSAAIFLGNVLAAANPGSCWLHYDQGRLGIERPDLHPRYPHPADWRPTETIWVSGTVPAILRADDTQLASFQEVADGWWLPRA